MSLKFKFPRILFDRGNWKHHPASTVVAVALVCLVAAYLILQRRYPAGVSSFSPPPTPSLPQQKIQWKQIVGNFKRNQTLADALTQHGLSRREVHRLVESTRPVYDLARVKASRPYWLTLSSDGGFRDFRYAVDDERYLTVYRKEDEYVPVLKSFRYETRIQSVSGVIEDSLLAIVTDLGEQEQLALSLADIFRWDIDFYTDIHKGDSFRMLVEKKFLDGRLVKYGPILAAEINNQGKTFSGFRFESGHGTYDYYSADGKALRKSFLKSPLKFAQITSRFSQRRFHPILKRVLPHLGVDYAAPAGTPVVAVGSGTVALAGRDGVNGVIVKLRHGEGLETFYLHLSRIVVRPGARVGQGEVIGYVGSTGLAKGPHLDFRVIQRGKYIDPTKVIFPPAPPVPPSSFARFAALRDKLVTQLQKISFEREEAGSQ